MFFSQPYLEHETLFYIYDPARGELSNSWCTPKKVCLGGYTGDSVKQKQTNKNKRNKTDRGLSNWGIPGGVYNSTHINCDGL